MKPKQLTGEVKRFIDEVIFAGITVECVKDSSYANHYNKIQDFYNQPFKPEMITEYFEGWELSDCWQRYNYFRKGETRYRQTITIGIGEMGCYPYKPNGERIDIGVKPKTLSDFITFCLAADIKLRWK